METSTLAAPEVLLDLDLDALGRGESPGLTPDRRAGVLRVHARPARRLLRRARPADGGGAGRRRTREHTWEVSHIGGDRFAANLLVLPDGLYYGRVTPRGRARRWRPPTSTGTSTSTGCAAAPALPFAVQVAEVAARRATGATGLRDVRVLSVERDGAAVRRTPRRRSARRTTSGSAAASGSQRHLLTCRAQRDNPVPEHEVLDVSPVTSGRSSSARSSTPSPPA